MIIRTIINNSAPIIIDNNWMISDGSCDTEDWSNDAENSALITEINDILYSIYSNRKLEMLFETIITFHNIYVFTVLFIK